MQAKMSLPSSCHLSLTIELEIHKEKRKRRKEMKTKGKERKNDETLSPHPTLRDRLAKLGMQNTHRELVGFLDYCENV